MHKHAKATCPQLRTIILILSLVLFFANPIICLTVTGTIATPCEDSLSSLQVAAYGRDGAMKYSGAVTASATFTLFLPVTERTHFILYLLGAIENHYHPIILHVDPQRVLLAHVRKDALEIPPDARGVDYETSIVHFEPAARTAFSTKGKEKRWTWNILWSYQRQMMLVAVAAFVVAFPRLIRQLPLELREELIGEKEAEAPDPNDLFKALCGFSDAAPVHVSSTDT